MYVNKEKRAFKGKSLLEKVVDYTVVDIETTSLDAAVGEILEISAIKVRNRKEVETFSEIIKVNHEVGSFTTNLTGITTKMVEEEGKDLTCVLLDFKEFLGDDIIVGHNVNFDINFLYDSMREQLGDYLTNDYIDTLRISRKILKELGHHRLDDLIDYFGLTRRREHRALNDCVLTNQVYLNLCHYEF